MLDTELLGRVALFASLDRLTLARLAAYLEPVTMADGEIVVRQGEPGDSLYVVAAGLFGVYAGTDEARAPRVGTLEPGDYFGEMALLTELPRTATVRAEGAGEVLRLERDRFERLVKEQPAVALTVVRTLTERLVRADAAVASEAAVVEALLAEGLGRLAPAPRARVLEASLLERPTPGALQALYGAEAVAVAAALAELGAADDEAGVSLAALRQQFTAEQGPAAATARARELAARLIAARRWEDALPLLARVDRAAFAAAMREVVQTTPPPDDELLRSWVARLGDEEAAHDVELALCRARHHQSQGNVPACRAVLRHAIDHATTDGNTAGSARLSAALARLAPKPAASAGPLALAHGRWSTLLVLALVVLLLGAAVVAGRGQPAAFLYLFAAAIILWVHETLPNAIVALGLLAGWLMLGLATPQQALGGFATSNWVFVIAVLGIATATAQSGLLFRGGLMLVRRLPQGLIYQAATLIGTGVLLQPLLPQNQARIALTAPIAQSIADSERLPDHDPRAAVLGLAAWMGAGPLMFWFLNGSSFALMAWGLLPDADRARFDLVFWTVAVAPFGLLATLGALAALLLALRPSLQATVSPERVDLQIAVLGPPSAREWSMLGVLAGTLVGVILAPRFGLPDAIGPVLGLIAAAATGNFGARSLRALDWNFLLYYGIVLSAAALIGTLGLDKAAAALVGGQLGHLGIGGLGFVLLAAVVNMVVRLAVPQSQALLILGLSLFPVAASLGVNPWVVAIALLATNSQFLIPNQTISYLTGYTAVDGRLWTHAQARRVCLLYDVAVLLALVLAAPWWHFLGLI